MEIEYLRDHMEHAETVAKWCYDEFINGIKTDVSYEDVLGSVNKCGRTELPVRFIALIDGRCAGTIAIYSNDLRCRDYTPWLAALYVGKEYRNRGIGGRLIEKVKEAAAELGYRELYLRTEHAGNYYRKLGWTFIEECDDDYELRPEVFKFKLK